MKTKQCFLAMLSALILLLSSCSGGGADEVEYIAFRDGEGLWGLVSPKGEVLFEGRFKNKPSLVLHGVFSVKNDEGTYEVYTAEAEPKQVGEPYTSIGDFFDGVAPAVPSLGYIRYINTKGETDFELKEAEGKPVSWAGNFHDGRARFKSDGKYGYIDRKGKVAISAIYSEVNDFHDGRAVVTDTTGKWLVIDKDGNRIFGKEEAGGNPVCYEDYTHLGYSEGLLPVINGFSDMQLYDTDGKPVGEAMPFSSIQSFKNGVAVFSYKNKQALVDTKGGQASTSAYHKIFYNGHLRFALEDYRGKVFRLDDQGERTGSEEYTTVSLYRSFVKDCDKYMIVRDLKGRGNVLEASSGKAIAPCQPGIDLGFKERTGATSEYVDSEKLFALLSITTEGIGGAKLNQSAAVNAKGLGINPEEYTRPDFLATTKEIPEGSFETFVQFSDYMMTDGNPRTFRTDLNADEITVTLTLYNVTPTMCEGFFKQLVRHIAKVCGNNPDEADNFTTIENKFFTPEGHTIDLLRKNNVFELRMWDEPDMDIADEDNEMI